VIRSIFLVLIAAICFGCSSVANNKQVKSIPPPPSASDTTPDAPSVVYRRDAIHKGYSCPDPEKKLALVINSRLVIHGHFENNQGKTFTHAENGDGKHYICDAAQAPNNRQLVDTQLDSCCLAEKATFIFK